MYNDQYLAREFILRARKHVGRDKPNKDQLIQKFDYAFSYYLDDDTVYDNTDLCRPYEFAFKFPPNVAVLYINHESQIKGKQLRQVGCEVL